jgi:hypothetical protein
MTLPAVHPLPAMTVLCAQKLLQQGTAQLGHGGPHGQLHRLQALASAPGGHRQCRQPFYLGGELRLDLLAEPPFSPPEDAGGAGADAPGGRASQIASFTSTICSLMSANR